MRWIIFPLSFLLLLPFFFPVEKLELKDQVNGDVLPGQADNVGFPAGDGPAQTSFTGMNEGRRLTTDDPGEIMRVINEIHESKAFNIVFVGDSIVYGDGTMKKIKQYQAHWGKNYPEWKRGRLSMSSTLRCPAPDLLRSI